MDFDSLAVPNSILATCGPSFGPLISAYSVEAKGWRWSQWELIWLAGPVLIIMFVFLPETSSDTILLRRAARLRKSTGNDRILSQSEKDHETLSPHKVLFNALIKPVGQPSELSFVIFN